MTSLRHYTLPLAALVAVLLVTPAFASAQTVGSGYVTISTSPSNNSYAPGSVSANMGTLTLSANQPGSYQVASIPLALATAGGGSTAYLSNCQLLNSSGAAITTNGNGLSSLSTTGNNTFNLDSPISVTYGSPVTLRLTCNIASTAQTGGTYAFTPVSVTSTTSGTPTIGARLTTFPTVTPGEMNAPIALVTVNPGSTSGTSATISSFPLMITYGNGLTSSYLSNCHTTYAGSTLDSSSSGALNSGTNTITLNSPLTATGGSAAMPLLYSCTISAAAPVGGTIGISFSPASIVASNASNGFPITVAQGIDPTTGMPGVLSGTTRIVASGSGGTSTGTLPPGDQPPLGAPNTGDGAGAVIIRTFLATLAVLAMLATGYLLAYARPIGLSDAKRKLINKRLT